MNYITKERIGKDFEKKINLIKETYQEKKNIFVT